MDDDFREVRCRRCQAVFYLCRRDDRGQSYCTDACRRVARATQKRAARATHQRSPMGRDDHRDRVRDYRARRCVMDQGSRKVAPAATVGPGAGEMPMDGTSESRVEGDDDVHATGVLAVDRDAGHVRCAVCGRPGRFIRFHHFAWRRRSRTIPPPAPRPP